MGKIISVYITADEHRVLSGDPLTLLAADPEARKELTREIALALKADVVQLKNGDYILLTHT